MPGIDEVVTEEAAVQTPAGSELRVTALVREGDFVPRGKPVACLRHQPDICFVAPISGRVARIALDPGSKLSRIVLFREGDARAEHDIRQADTPSGMRRLMQTAGLWPWLRRRPFGGMPRHDERPAAIMVMAADTRPLASDPRRALEGREDDLARGMAALATLTDGPVFLLQSKGLDLVENARDQTRIRKVICGARHPQGAAGIRLHQLCPAGLDTPVWDIHAEDTAALGTLLRTGILPMARLVRIAGPALREARSVRTHFGADLRQLTHRLVAPGPHSVISGSALDGHTAQWLAPRHRQVTVLPRDTGPVQRHWLRAALTRSATGTPAIPTAALSRAFGDTLPVMPFIRALGAGDDETAMKLGVLSLLEEDVALADYILSADGALKAQLRGMLDRIQREFAA
ncbi:Na(+)-translocating NADH-quinone reductase subunit A [Roseivivax lentus]|nr:Na(+)-translocating NADH-quinone reductase subunit A [Roseivivax lentus]